MQDIVLAAARRIVGEREDGSRVVSLAQIQAAPEVQDHVNTPGRVIDIMNELGHAGLVYMICRHPEPRWRVNPEREG